MLSKRFTIFLFYRDLESILNYILSNLDNIKYISSFQMYHQFFVAWLRPVFVKRIIRTAPFMQLVWPLVIY